MRACHSLHLESQQIYNCHLVYTGTICTYESYNDSFDNAIMPTAGDELPTFLRNVFLISLTLLKNSSRIKLGKKIILCMGLFL